MPRTPRVVALLTVVALLATACDDEPRARPQEPPRVPDGPNVVIIMVDDLRAAGTVRGMKALRRHFRREGTEYTRAFATTPLCCPSRASIMTGLYVHNHNVETNDGRGFDQYPQDLTVQAQLQRAGYTTGYFGKYLNKWPIEEPPPYFDRWVTNSFGNPYFSGEYNIQGEVRDVHEYSTKYLTDELLSFIGEAERDDERPWFGVLAPNAVHGPSLPAVRFRELDVGAWEGNPAVHEADRSDKPARVRATQRTLADSQEIR